MVLEVEPVFHKTLRFPVPPTGKIIAEPSLRPKQVMFVLLGLIFIAGGSETINGTRISQVLASVISNT